MGSSEQHRRRAEDLERQAARSATVSHAVELMKLAKSWRALADEVERLDAARDKVCQKP